MNYQTPGVAYETLKSLYTELKESAEEYARRDTARQFVVDRQYNQLQQFYMALVIFEPLIQGVVPYFIINQATQLLEHDCALDGLHLIIRTRSAGNNLALLEYCLYDPATD